MGTAPWAEQISDTGSSRKRAGRTGGPSGCLLKEGAAVNPEKEGLGEEDFVAPFFRSALAPSFELARGNAAVPRDFAVSIPRKEGGREREI